MTLLPILLHPDPVLRKISQPVIEITDDIVKLTDDMLQTMLAAPGIGLAAPQVGVLQRVVVIDLNGRNGVSADALRLINPEVIARSDEESELKEGCLSLPEMVCPVWRPSEVTVKYMDINGNQQTIEASGLLAKCLQHEIDHLNGKLIFDYLSPLKRNMVLRRYTKMLKDRVS